MRKLVMLLSLFQLIAIFSFAQNRTIAGRITDENGKPIVGASVLVKGTTIGAATNSEGIYSLQIPASAKTLVVSSINMMEKEIDINAGNTYNVSLSSTINDLENIVVTVPYGTVKKKAFTGAENTVTSLSLIHI